MSPASQYCVFALALLITSGLVAGCTSPSADSGVRSIAAVATSTATDAPILVPTDTPATEPTTVPTDTAVPAETPTATAIDVVMIEPTPTDTPTPTGTPMPADMPTPEPPADTSSGPTGNGSVIIESIYFDGDVPQVESDEYAVIANVGEVAQDMTGWRLNAGNEGQDFYFPAYTLEAGASCRVYTNEVHPETCGFSFGINQAVWRNKGECGYLYDASGVAVSQFCF